MTVDLLADFALCFPWPVQPHVGIYPTMNAFPDITRLRPPHPVGFSTAFGQRIAFVSIRSRNTGSPSGAFHPEMQFPTGQASPDMTHD